MIDCQQAQASTGRPPPGQEKMSLSKLWQTLVKTHRLPDGTDIPPLVISIRDKLHDPEKEVRQHALRVLADLIIALPKKSLEQHIRPLLPSIVMNLGHNSLAVRKSVVDCLKVYIRHSPTSNDVFSEIIKIDEDTSPNILSGILTCIPSLTRPDVLSNRSIEKAIDTLWNNTQQCVNEEICMKALAKIRWKTGTDTFYKLLGVDRLKPFENLCKKYGLLDTADEEQSSSSTEDKLILETEIQLDSGPSIKLQIHEECSDREAGSSSDHGIVRVLEDDSDFEFYETSRETPRTPRRVHFGGEIVKMRTPESDSTQTSDSEKIVKKSTSQPVQSFMRVKENTKSKKINLGNTKKQFSSSMDNLISSSDSSKDNSKIPVPLNSAPSSPTKTLTNSKRKLHHSAPNLSRSSKIPKKLVSEKNKTSTNTSNEKTNHLTPQSTKTKHCQRETNLVQDKNVYKIKENTKMIELSIKNDIALQIMFSNGNGCNENKEKNNNSVITITELPQKKQEGETSEKRSEEETETDKNVSKSESDFSKSEESVEILSGQNSRSTEGISENDSTTSFEKASGKEEQTSKVSDSKVSSTNLKEKEESIILPKISAEKQKAPIVKAEIDKRSKKKEKLTLNINANKVQDNGSRVSSPLIDEKLLLQSMSQPRRYSRAEDILSPAPMHNEIEILHNLTRSPEHTRKSKSRPPTASIESTSRAGTSQKQYGSFKVFTEDMVNNNTVSETDRNDQAMKGMSENDSKVESSELTKRTDAESAGKSSEIVAVQGISFLPALPVGKNQISLPEIITNLQEIDITKKSFAFDNLVASLQDVNFIKSFDTANTKILLQLLFLFETQARFRKGSRDSLYTILENVHETTIRECLPQIAKGIGRMGAPYGVRLAISVMKRTHLGEELLSYLPYESSRGREGSLQILMAACRLFPSTDIDINNSIKKALFALGDRRKRIRHASLETLASLAQVSGNSAVLEIARQVLQDEESKNVLLQVIRARLSRRQLPMVDFDGNIRYTIPREPAEIEWLSPGGTTNHSAPSLLQRDDLRHRDDLIPLRNHHAVIPLDLNNQRKLTQRRGVLKPVYCVLPSAEESDEGPSIYYPDKYGRGRSILPPAEKIRCESQDRIRWRDRSHRKPFNTKYDIKKSFSSDQLYHSQPVSLDYKANMTSTSSISSGSDYSSSNGSQPRSIRWQGSGIPVLRPRGHWGSFSEKSRIPHDSPASFRSIQRQSSGSESSGYFTPPPAERPSARMSPVDRPIERPESVIKAVTPLDSPRILSAAKKTIENDTSQEEPQQEQEDEPVEYIEVINSSPADLLGEKIEHDEMRTKSNDNLLEQRLNLNDSQIGVDEIDRKGSCPSINEFDLNTTRPIAENRRWSKSEVNLGRSLPIIRDRKNVNSAPLIKDIFNNNIVNDAEETTLTGPTHICNNTNINITIPLPGSLIQEEEVQPPAPMVRRLSKRYSQVPIPKKIASKPIKTENSARGTSKTKTDVVHDILERMASQEWETVMIGLRNLGKLAKTNNEIIEAQMHSVCLSLANHIKNLRSQVARAACQASKEMFVACSQKGLETELEEIVGPLLHRTADTNKFLREDANRALDSMSEKIHPAKVITVLTTKGTTHQNAIVRSTAARLLEQLVRTNGTEKIFSLGKDVRDRVILAGANGLTEGSLETRKFAKALLRHMISHPNFQKALLEAVPPHTIRHIAKTLNSLKNSE